MPLTEEGGIDLLGDIIENGGTVAPNERFYGNLHNMGHVAIAFSHDPVHRHSVRNQSLKNLERFSFPLFLWFHLSRKITVLWATMWEPCETQFSTAGTLTLIKSLINTSRLYSLTPDNKLGNLFSLIS